LTWFDFIAHIIGSLAWPIAAVTIAVFFRKPIAQLIGNITRFKVGSLEGEVRSGLKELSPATEIGDSEGSPEQRSGTQANELPQPSQLALPPPSQLALPPPDEDVIAAAPSGAVVQAWAQLEDVLRDAARRLDLRTTNDSEPVNAITITKRLLSANAIGATTLETIFALRQLRNRVVHSWAEAQRLSPDVAADFVGKVSEIAHRVRTGTNEVRCDVLLHALQATNARDVAVWPLALVGIGEDSETSERMARARVGRWGARAGEVLLEVSGEDAALLINEGAEYRKADSAGDHKLAKLALAER
jgi:hypothetical protein